MNIIEVTEKQLVDIIDWNHLNIKPLDNYYFRMPFEKIYKIIVVMRGTVNMVHEIRHVRENIYDIKLIGNGEIILRYETAIISATEKTVERIISESSDVDNFKSRLQQFNVGDIKKLTTDLANGTTSSIMAITNYFIYHRQDYDMLEERERKTIKKKGRYKYASGKNAIKITKTYRLKKPVVEGDESKRIKREIKCESWGVRGHYRHYKNGKVVFVKPYVKGKKRGEIAPKDTIYRI